MSVLNQMLKDLDQRKEPASSGASPLVDLPKQGPGKRAWWLWPLVIAGSLSVGAGGAWVAARLSATWAPPVLEMTVPVTLPLTIAETPPPAVSPVADSSDLVAAAPDMAPTNPKVLTVKPLVPEQPVAESVAAEPVLEVPAAEPAIAIIPDTRIDPPEVIAPVTVNSDGVENAPSAEPAANLDKPVDNGQPVSLDELFGATEQSPAANQAAEQDPEQMVPADPPGRLEIQQVELTAEEIADKAFGRAQKAMQTGDSSTAEAQLKQALKVLPAHIPARRELAALYYGQRREAEAIRLLREGISRHPDEPQFRLMLARLHSQDQQWQTALDQLRGLAPHPAHNLGYYDMQGAIAQRLQHHELARRSYETLLGVDPGQGRWWLGLALAFDGLAMPPQAAEAYRRALATRQLSAASDNYAKTRLQALGGTR